VVASLFFWGCKLTPEWSNVLQNNRLSMPGYTHHTKDASKKYLQVFCLNFLPAATVIEKHFLLTGLSYIFLFNFFIIPSLSEIIPLEKAKPTLPSLNSL
jgi:hypothetical protein